MIYQYTTKTTLKLYLQNHTLNNMDRQEYGKIIVDQIIDDYKASSEYRHEAKYFIRQWIINIINYKIGGVGMDFSNAIQANVGEEHKQEFIDGMEKWTDLKEKLDELFDLTCGEYESTLYPSNRV